MFALKLAAPLLATAMAAVSLTALPAASEPGRGPGDSCLLRAQQVRVKQVQLDNLGTDQAVVRLGNSSTIIRSYTPPQSRNTLGDGQELFSNTATVALLVDGGGGVPVMVGQTSVPCQNATLDRTFDNGDARYKVRLSIQVQP